jgi:hypothetical protein
VPGGADPQTASLPVVRFWYGSEQSFGRPGLAQRWVNVLGDVTKAESVTALEYRLDGEPPRPLRAGPDHRRLRAAGDFNVEIEAETLRSGRRRVRVAAIDDLDQRTARTARLSYARERWPLPYAIDWEDVARVGEVVQVVDGLWIWDDDGVRPHPRHVGYDRVLAVGDVEWTDYEVESSITVNTIDEIIGPESGAPGLGVNLRWQGHTDEPVGCPPPHCGWEPTGASAWLDFGLGEVRLIVAAPHATVGSNAIRPALGERYRFRARVETAGDTTRYRFKIWQARAREPDEWTLATQRTGAPERGSFLLVAHHVDATFGDLSVKPVPAGE